MIRMVLYYTTAALIGLGIGYLSMSLSDRIAHWWRRR